MPFLSTACPTQKPLQNLSAGVFVLVPSLVSHSFILRKSEWS
jgi:hypothetical protein